MAEVEPWQYRVDVLETSDVYTMQNFFNRVGSQGWELVTVMTPIKMLGNQLVVVFKKPGLGDLKPEKEWY
jgi:hypothetical protein